MINKSETFITRSVYKILIYSVLLSLFIASVNSCGCPNCESEENAVNIPASILSSADNFVLNKVGEQNYKKHFVIDFSRSQKKNTFYEIHYRFIDKQNESINEDVFLFVGEDGKVIETMEMKGVPDCRKNPEACENNIDEKSAIEIARKNKLKEGVRDWEVSFRWSPELNRYIWHILATYKEMGSGEFYKAQGEEIQINPYDGSVLKKREWAIR